jgi:hypothetical protein
MAVEVEIGAYIYNHGGSMFFSHNPLHDLESLWWVGIWILLCHYQPSNLGDITVQQHIKFVKVYGETLFNNHIDSRSRRRALTGQALLTDIQPRFFPEAVQYLILLLDVFRDELTKYYGIYKPMASQDRSFFNSDLYRKFGDIFEDVMKELRNDETGLWPFNHIETRITYLNAKK